MVKHWACVVGLWLLEESEARLMEVSVLDHYFCSGE